MAIEFFGERLHAGSVAAAVGGKGIAVEDVVPVAVVEPDGAALEAEVRRGVGAAVGPNQLAVGVGSNGISVGCG